MGPPPSGHLSARNPRIHLLRWRRLRPFAASVGTTRTALSFVPEEEPSRATTPLKSSPEVLEVLGQLIHVGERVHDPFAGPGLRLAKVCDALDATFTGADIEAWPGGDGKFASLTPTTPQLPTAAVHPRHQPRLRQQAVRRLRQRAHPAHKTKGRRDYGIALGRALIPANTARVTGRPGHASGYWQGHRDAVKHWDARVLLNVDGPIAGEWVGLLVERNYYIEETVLAPTRRYHGLANADKRAEHEVVIVASEAR